MDVKVTGGSMGEDRFDRLKKDREILEEEAKTLGHAAVYKSGGGHSDQYVCTCGWESRCFWDGSAFAHMEWQGHAKEIIEVGQVRLVLA
jgi:hypothetical protein